MKQKSYPFTGFSLVYDRYKIIGGLSVRSTRAATRAVNE